jgi:hypothetical protein
MIDPKATTRLEHILSQTVFLAARTCRSAN